ncbi:hypothetical protein CASFOL_023203 [Castilleja foliolosa]|uniref:BHLH domain-containing protein n=1 Tax=Castilleja foliolosa TaxID=1961234 RepID=A0ABD3CLT4_9LAMI
MYSTSPSCFYELGTCSDSYDHYQIQNPKLSPRSMAEAKAVAATNSHKEAERRRRKRINAHIATLKSILPNNIKTDKASLLGEAVRRVKELKTTTAQLSNIFPIETDELKVARCENSGLIMATLSCEDRPDIIMDMIRALKTAEAKVVRAEMSTVGGRTKSVLWVKMEGSENDVGLGTLRRGLRMVMDKSTLLAGSGQGLPGNKRPRYYQS